MKQILKISDRLVVEVRDGGGTLVGTLKESCPQCGGYYCTEPKDCEDSPLQFNTAMDALEAVILAHACAGIDVGSPEYKRGLQVAIEACENNLPGGGK